MMLWWIYRNGFAEDLQFFVAESDMELLDKFNATRREALDFEDVMYGAVEEVEDYKIDLRRIEA